MKVTVEYTGGDVEFLYKSFRNFAGMHRWMKKEEGGDGIPWREAGSKPIYCRRGVCTMNLVDGQMRHSHVFLTKLWYGRSRGRVYVKRLYIVYG